MDTKEMIKVMQAYVDGKEIEFSCEGRRCIFRIDTHGDFKWNWQVFDYRIKPVKKKIRVYETINGYLFVTTELYSKIENDPLFKRWVTDWLEVIDENN